MDAALVLNIASFCFFLAEVTRLERHWRARNDMTSTSFEGIILHIVGNGLISIVGLYASAWFTLGFESFLICLGFISLYWKFRWMRKYVWRS